jgi:hypothetical protein
MFQKYNKIYLNNIRHMNILQINLKDILIKSHKITAIYFRKKNTQRIRIINNTNQQIIIIIIKVILISINSTLTSNLSHQFLLVFLN